MLRYYAAAFCGYISRWVWALSYSSLKSYIEKVDFVDFDEMALFKCNVCEKLFKRVDNLNRHKKNVHERKTEARCENCKKIFSRVDNLKRHQKVCGKFYIFF